MSSTTPNKPTCYRRVHKVLERNGVATSPETVRRLMRQEGLEGVSAPPQGPHHRACCRPDRPPRPDRKELHSRCSGPETGG
ncbi:IS3 family transposase [[Pseudopropionibacterium] massiliense]|uniref:IS3 family transposase n=1 Tax=[Pseudopropionibacterium] massiliense TaxID=2220000 RepID=UPI00102FD16A